MKLSEAMRIGATKTEPGRVDLLTKDADGKWHACALGAVLVGNGHKPSYATERRGADLLAQEFPELDTKAKFSLPELSGNGALLLNEAIWFLNDKFGWPRESIADWLEGLGY